MEEDGNTKNPSGASRRTTNYPKVKKQIAFMVATERKQSKMLQNKWKQGSEPLHSKTVTEKKKTQTNATYSTLVPWKS